MSRALNKRTEESIVVVFLVYQVHAEVRSVSKAIKTTEYSLNFKEALLFSFIIYKLLSLLSPVELYLNEELR